MRLKADLKRNGEYEVYVERNQGTRIVLGRLTDRKEILTVETFLKEYGVVGRSYGMPILDRETVSPLTAVEE